MVPSQRFQSLTDSVRVETIALIQRVNVVMIFARLCARRATFLTFLLLCFALYFVFALIKSEVDAMPLISGTDNRQVGLVVASIKKEDTRWTLKLFPKWKIYRYIVDDASAEYGVPVNKGHEAMPYLT